MKIPLKQLKMVQNYVLKIIHNKTKGYPTELLHSEEIFNIRSLYILHTCIYIHKITKMSICKSFLSRLPNVTKNHIIMYKYIYFFHIDLTVLVNILV